VVPAKTATTAMTADRPFRRAIARAKDLTGLSDILRLSCLIARYGKPTVQMTDVSGDVNARHRLA
jgi:hypothetical protein